MGIIHWLIKVFLGGTMLRCLLFLPVISRRCICRCRTGGSAEIQVLCCWGRRHPSLRTSSIKCCVVSRLTRCIYTDFNQGFSPLCAFSFCCCRRRWWLHVQDRQHWCCSGCLGVLVPMPNHLTRFMTDLGFSPIFCKMVFDLVLASDAFCRG